MPVPTSLKYSTSSTILCAGAMSNTFTADSRILSRDTRTFCRCSRPTRRSPPFPPPPAPFSCAWPCMRCSARASH